MKPLPINPGETSPLQSLSQANAKRVAGHGTDEFKQMLQNYLSEVNSLQHQADKAVQDLATGQAENLHELIVAVNEADISFRLMMEMRNKLVDAYKEIMRMQV